MRVVKSPSDTLALTNCIIVNPRDFDSSIRYIIIDEQFAFTIRTHESVQPGELGTSMFHRRFAGLSLGQELRVRPFDPFSDGLNCYLGTLHLQVSFLRKGYESGEAFDTQEMSKIFIQQFNGQIFTKGQGLVFDFRGINMMAVVMDVDVVDFEALRGAASPRQVESAYKARTSARGILMQQTTIQFTKAPDSNIKLKGGSRSGASTAIVNPDFKFEDMGIGGLDKEFSNLFRRAFASRIFPPLILEKLDIKHVKGILLYGPPGTGKTLMARQIGKMLNGREPLVVNGPEILNKYVGASEENIRKLFAPAEQEYKERGEESSLHIIIFDELDAICKQRGSKNDGTGVGDSIVNQLLSKMDGVNQLNNILVIGMTNRLDMIDEALLRPGRMEIHLEISLPDEKGRLQIIKIHTQKMRDNNIMHSDVDLEELAALTKNFSGAEIAGLIKSATSFAFNRHVKVGTLATVAPDVSDMKVKREDFLLALDEVHASFGVSETEFEQSVANGVIRFSTHVDRILSDGKLYVEQVRNSALTPLVSVLLHGPPGSGKTALAASIAMNSDFPFIKLISPESMVGYSEASKMSQINKVFNDAYKSPLSIIVVDCIERLLDWVPIGPRFSNSVLQTLLVLLRKPPPKDRRLLILATTSQRQVLEQMDMLESFDASIYTPNITDLGSLDLVLQELKLFNGDQDRYRALHALQSAGMADKLSIGIKKLMMVTERARQDDDTVEKFVSALTDEGAVNGFQGAGADKGRLR
ncbi:transport between ER and Golgi ATPase protein [Quaeritorhiza haematococci]|nr:transport between ER and Golgi ATPase protein [Quaeritorhiza haematococci]